MKTSLRVVNDHGVIYEALMFVCPGCVSGGHEGYEGVHMLAVNAGERHNPSWRWNGNRELPTLDPSIRTRGGVLGEDAVCHSFLKDGIFEFLDDSTHPLAGQKVPIPDLPEWVDEH